MTPAQELRALMAAAPAPQSLWAGWLGVTPNTVTRWVMQARADDGEPVKGPRMPPPMVAVQAAKLITLAHLAAPGLLGALVWPAGTWLRRLRSVEGRLVERDDDPSLPPPLTLADRLARRAYLDGADSSEGDE